MKQIIQRVSLLLESLVSACLLPLFWVKLFREVGVFPGFDETTGEYITVRRYYDYSIIDNLWKSSQWLVELSIALLVCSVIVSLLAFFLKGKRRLGIAAHVLFVVAVVVFLIVFLLAASVQRVY